MNKVELIDAVCNNLRNENKRKPVSVPKQVFTITDDEGSSRTFTVKRKDRMAIYTLDDVKNVINATIDILIDAVKRGEPVYIPKIGTLSTHFREARKVRIPGSRQWKDIPAHYVPKMDYATCIKDAARVYETYIKEIHPPQPEKPKRGRGRPRKVDPADYAIPKVAELEKIETDEESVEEVT